MPLRFVILIIRRKVTRGSFEAINDSFAIGDERGIEDHNLTRDFLRPFRQFVEILNNHDLDNLSHEI